MQYLLNLLLYGFFVFVFFTQTFAANSATLLNNDDAESIAVSETLKKFYSSYQKADSTERKKLWHENSPIFIQKENLDSANLPVFEKDFKIYKLEINKGRDRIYANAEITFPSADSRHIGLIKEGNDWKIWQESSLAKYQNALDSINKTSVNEQNGLDFAGSLCWIAYVMFQKKDFQNAVNIFILAQEAAKKINDNIIIASIYMNIGNAYNDLGQPKSALQSFQKGYDLAKTINFQTGILRGLYGIGNASNALGKYYEARNAFENRLSLLQKNGSPRRIALTFHTLGITYFNLGDYEKSLKSYQESLKINGKTIELLNDIGFLFIEIKNYSEAEKYFKESLQMAKENERTIDMRRSLNGLGKIESDRKNYREALNYLQESLKFTDAGKNEESQILLNQGEVYYLLKDFQAAENTFEKAIQLAQENDFFESLWYGKYLLGKCLKAQNKSAEALRNFEESTEKIENWLQTAEENADLEGFFQNKVDPYREIVSLLAEKNEVEKALKYAELSKAKTLLHSIRGSGKISLSNNISDLNKLLPDKETALIEYVVGEEAAYVFLIQKPKSGSTPQIIVKKLNKSGKQIAELVEKFYEKIITENYDFSDDSQELYQTLLKPLESYLADKKKLVIVPDGILWNLPFQTLKINSMRYLLDKYAISYTRSLSVLLTGKGKTKIADDKSDGKLLAIANPKYSLPIPFAEESTKILQAVYGTQNTTIFAGEIATEEKIKEVISNFEVIHFATHGIINNESPMSSYLQLTAENSGEDGKLEAVEIKDFRLNAKLVVLAGCDTGTGKIIDGEGIIGLTWALENAGVGKIIVSQWKVKDKSTKDLMTEFHRLYMESRKNKLSADASDALRLSALTLRKKYPHPIYWAGFTLILNGN
jgi:CHAT domain-containing protein